MINNIKKIIKDCDFLYFLYERVFGKAYQAYCKKLTRKRFHRYSKELLMTFDKVMRANRFNYFLAFGTLLGAVREKGFINHDLDIDVGMWADEYSPQIRVQLEESGFNLVHAITVDDGIFGREETYAYKGVHIDIFFFYPYDSELSYCCDFVGHNHKNSWRESLKHYGGVLPRQIMLPLRRTLVETDFQGLVLRIPENYDEVLKFRYGYDYMIPNPQWSWVSSSGQNVVERPDKLGVVIG